MVRTRARLGKAPSTTTPPPFLSSADGTHQPIAHIQSSRGGGRDWFTGQEKLREELGGTGMPDHKNLARLWGPMAMKIQARDVVDAGELTILGLRTSMKSPWRILARLIEEICRTFFSDDELKSQHSPSPTTTNHHHHGTQL
ncbi:hypothetical protein TIFTF001_009071 [Ficus carica]|uniref:Uncharacterized protein n=1 Tax=Ficus carica TaxID=3494 RepID=A0AA88DHB4_FICCA|nr:hypothetical protein TIFTF001_009071 [Ficus carica]